MFCFSDGNESTVERMWVIVREKTKEGYVGVLDNAPYCTEQIQSGVEVSFQPRHVIAIRAK
jgi:uncharacterized protein YegJ (DUF2314 family)